MTISVEAWTAIGAVATVSGVVFSVISLWPQIRAMIPWRKKRLFLSMQMSGLAGVEYQDVRKDVMELVYSFRTRHKVYFYNEFIQKVEEFEESTFDANKYLRKIAKCDLFIAVITKKVVSSIYFEAGVALCQRCRCVFFISNDNVLPLVMRRVASENNRIHIFRTTELSEVKRVLTNIVDKKGA